LLQSTVVAVADARTNTVLVTASHDTMLQIARTIGRLDASTEKKQRVYTHTLQYSDPDNVAAILQTMFGNQNGSSTVTQPSTSRLNSRTTTGASADVTSIMSNTGGAGGAGAAGR
jgi:hypothetical protein